MAEPTNKHVMLYGGARSGKTRLFVAAIINRAQKYPGSRHLIARLRFSHAKASIWLDTLSRSLGEQADPTSYSVNESDHYVRFNNGSEIWVDGLDDKERVDKILGREYMTIFFNEISQIPYDTVTTVLTRLSQRGGRNVAYYDLNPAGNQHWAKKLFIDERPPGYACMRINPFDNEQHLPEGYIDDILSKLPEHKRRRFLDGEWSDPEGTIFTTWQEVDEIPEGIRLHSRRAYGLDFGFSLDPAALVALHLNGDDLYVDELLYETGQTNIALARQMTSLVDQTVWIGADSSEPKSIAEIGQQGFNIEGALKGPDSVNFGIDWLLSKQVYVTSRSQNVWNEQANYAWEKRRDGTPTGRPIDDYNHAMDAIRYGAQRWMRGEGRIADWSAADLGL